MSYPVALPLSTSRRVLLGSAAALVLGVFLPWITVSAPLVGFASRNGLGAGWTDGWFMLVGAAAMAYAAFYQKGWWLMVAAVGVGALAVLDVLEVVGRIEEAREALLGNPFAGAFSAQVGNGLWLILIASAVAAVAAAGALREEVGSGDVIVVVGATK